MDVTYSLTQPGYRAWLEDGNEGTYEDFLQDQARVSDKEHIINTIVDEPEGAEGDLGDDPGQEFYKLRTCNSPDGRPPPFFALLADK